MKKSLAILLSVAGMALVATGPVWTQRDNPPPPSGMATGIYNNRTGPAPPDNNPLGGSCLAMAADNEGPGTPTATFNTSLAILTGMFTLMVLQRRNDDDIVLGSRS